MKHHCESPGLTTDAPVLTQCPNHDKPPYWKAVAQIGTIFGSKVHGEIVGIGATKEQALERLAEERKKLYESIWA